MGLTLNAGNDSLEQTHWRTFIKRKDISVTQDNKQEYFDLLVSFMINASISKCFNSFKKRFIICWWGEILSLLESDDLEILIWR